MHREFVAGEHLLCEGDDVSVVREQQHLGVRRNTSKATKCRARVVLVKVDQDIALFVRSLPRAPPGATIDTAHHVRPRTAREPVAPRTRL